MAANTATAKTVPLGWLVSLVRIPFEFTLRNRAASFTDAQHSEQKRHFATAITPLCRECFFPRIPLLFVLNGGYRVAFLPCPLRFGRYDRSPFHPEFVDRWTNLHPSMIRRFPERVVYFGQVGVVW